ncbi:MAG TPA: hypothetical protein VFA74_02690 [Terriglobales bacterium]|nr:hypothetical protein [Terriglobales bacterium]
MPVRIILFLTFMLLFVPFCLAQTATCTNWKFFNTVLPSGINDRGVVVGSIQQDNNVTAGVVRRANGSTRTFIDPNAAPPTDWTLLTRRNTLGLTVGWYRDANQYAHGLLLSGSRMATFDYPGAVETILYGINSQDSIVGIWGLGDFSQPYDGFRMRKNGSPTTIHYPGAMMTNPMSVSDTSIVVGWYVEDGAQAPFPYHGFVLAKGVYSTLDYPNADRTLLNDINRSGVIAGTHITTGSNYTQGGFIYVNGTFKEVTAPDTQVLTVDGINNYNDVTGTSSVGSFTAHCQ